MGKTLRLPRGEMPKPSQPMRDRRKRKEARSSQKAELRKQWAR